MESLASEALTAYGYPSSEFLGRLTDHGQCLPVGEEPKCGAAKGALQTCSSHSHV